MKTKLMIVTTALAAVIGLGSMAFAQPPAAVPPPAAKHTPAKASPAKNTPAAAKAAPAPTADEIAAAQAKGMVWVNQGTKVYHKNGQFYGKTKNGKFMTEADAQKAGYKAAKEPAAHKKADSKKKS